MSVFCPCGDARLSKRRPWGKSQSALRIHCCSDTPFVCDEPPEKTVFGRTFVAAKPRRLPIGAASAFFFSVQPLWPLGRVLWLMKKYLAPLMQEPIYAAYGCSEPDAALEGQILRPA
ncbi:hypothetical protein Q3G72_033373 [Acer saccharum]|nr:hypothetical protein Q3G72_033373 [Acer saccharum]